MEVSNTVQKAVKKTIPKKKKCNKAKWLSKVALQIAEKRREAKGKEERERHPQLNAGFQIARRNKTACSVNNAKIQNKRIKNARDLFKKTGDTKGTFHAKMGIIKDKIGKDITEAEEIKKRWQE